MSVHIFRAFLSPAECAAIAKYTLTVRHALNSNRIGPHRFFRPLADLPELAPEIREMECRLWGATGFTAAERSPMIPSYLSINEPGGAIHRHTDPGTKLTVNTRFNLMVNKPACGEPVINEEIVHVGSGDAWAFVATTNWHRSLPVRDGLRIVVSFGYQIPRGDARLARLGIA